MSVVVPGQAPRALVARSAGELRSLAWSPDGGTLAVEREVDPTAGRRGRRHPWPKSVARDYQMFSDRGNAAVRRVVLRAARALRRGAGREETLVTFRRDYLHVEDRYPEADDSAVLDIAAYELDRWLHAAGFARIDALDEITC